MSGAASDIPMEGTITISYEDALERELEYKKRFELSQLGAPACNKFLPPPSHKLPTEQNLTGIKRKLVSGSLSVPVPPSTNDPTLPPKQFQGHQAHPHPQFRQPSICQLQDHKPSVRQTYNQQPSAQEQPFRRSLSLSLPPNQQPSGHNSQGRLPPYWCNRCKLNCENLNNLRIHCQGKKHKAKMLEVRAGKKTIVNEDEVVWCKECNVPCMNEYNLAQHCAGKKHAAIIQALKGNNGATSARVSYGRYE